jgi:glycosyltransferase involved in cell wall biosynthesis
MRVLFSWLGRDHIQANLAILLKTLVKHYPEDMFYLLCIEPGSLSAWRDTENMKVIALKAGISREWTRFRVSATGIKRLAREYRADVVWSINLGPYWPSGIPQVLGLHNAFQVYPRSVLRYHPRNRLGSAALRFFFRRSLATSDGVVVQTHLMAQYLRQMCPAVRVAVIPKAVESAEDVVWEPMPEHTARRLQQSPGREAFTFLYAAQSFPHKNHVTLVSALELLRSQGKQMRIAVTVSEDELKRLAGAKASSLVETGHLVPLGWVAKKHLRAAYDACQACVMPSVLESLSSAHLEAMQWDKPQISADLPYAHDLCGDASLYAPAEDPVAWAAQMEMLAQDAGLRGRLVEAGHLQMMTFPQTWREVAMRVHKFLAQVAGKDNSGSTDSSEY